MQNKLLSNIFNHIKKTKWKLEKLKYLRNETLALMF